MTAKEKAKQEYRNFYKEVIVYEFTPEEMKEFATQLCKEQREICYNAIDDYHIANDEDRADVLIILSNVKQPTIFEEGKK